MAQNRAFVYGDLFFETIKIKDGLPLYAAYHTERIAQSAKVLGMKLPDNWDMHFFTSLVKANVTEGDKRGRLVISRLATGFYYPTGNDVAFAFDTWELPEPKTKIATLDIYYEQFKACNTLSNLKTGNALVYILAAKFAHDKHIDDVLILNQYERIAEATSSNVFYFKGNTLFTPALTEAPVAGVMRKVVIEKAKKLGFEVQETKVEIKDLFEADECFLTNTIQGVVWVETFRNKKFANTLTSILQKAIQK